MKIYFAGAIRAGRDDVAIYETMIKWLQSFGEVLTEHVGDSALSKAGDDGPDDRHIHDRDMAWLASCDIVVAEVTAPSLGVGYELGWATVLKKPVLCLHRTVKGRTLSAMIGGSPGIQTAVYSSMDEAKRIMEEFIKKNAAGINGSVGVSDRVLHI
jgi:2'-deoxynucleoside 5'-phosphate N-hydrolase